VYKVKSLILIILLIEEPSKKREKPSGFVCPTKVYKEKKISGKTEGGEARTLQELKLRACRALKL
jgi:hypothetical protein